MIRARRVPLNRDGYDRFGAYWGVGQKLYFWYDETSNRDGHLRAGDNLDAVLQARAHMEHGGVYD